MTQHTNLYPVCSEAPALRVLQAFLPVVLAFSTQRGSSSVAMRLSPVTTVSYMKKNCSLSAAVSRGHCGSRPKNSSECLLDQALTLFEVLEMRETLAQSIGYLCDGDILGTVTQESVCGWTP